MREIGLPQTPEPTTIYCDNTAAIQIMENKGAIGKRSKAMDTQIYALRDRIVDQEVQLEYLGTNEMAADIGTKPLAREKFEYFRDIITGYALVKWNSQGRKEQEIMMGKDLRNKTKSNGWDPKKIKEKL